MNDSKLKTIVALCGAALLTAICAPVTADTLTGTNAAWPLTVAAPTSGWSTSVSFDDTAWQSATAVYSVDQYLGSAYVGTKGI